MLNAACAPTACLIGRERRMIVAGSRRAMHKLQQAAFISIGRAVGFSGLAIFTVMVGLSFEPLLALKSGGVLLLILLSALLLKAHRTPLINYRRTEAWLLLDRSDRPDERYAGQVLATALRDACLRFAQWTAGTAIFVWAGAVLLAWSGAGAVS